MALAETLLVVIVIYFGLGALFACAFVFKGANVIDPAAHSGTFGFRPLIFPGATALWPLLAKRWLSQSHSPEEDNPHRRAAQGN